MATETIISKARALFESVYRTAIVVAGVELGNQLRLLFASEQPFSVADIGWGKTVAAAVAAAVLRAVWPLITDAVTTGVAGVRKTSNPIRA